MSLKSPLWAARAKPTRPLKGTWDVPSLRKSASGGRQLGHATCRHFSVLRAPLRASPGASAPPSFPALLNLTLTGFLQHRSKPHSRMWRDWGHSLGQGWTLRKLFTAAVAELGGWLRWWTGVVFSVGLNLHPRSIHLVVFYGVVSMGLGFYVWTRQLFQCLAHSWSHPGAFHTRTPFFIWFKGSRSYLASETPNLISKIS